jgi:hypothetical protein
MMRLHATIFAFFIVIFLGGCGETAETAPKAELVTCHTAYRGSTGRPIEREDMLVFTDDDEQQKLSYDELVFNAQYSSGELDRERTLRLWVTERGESDPIIMHLYQLPLDSGPQNQFVGGHGFSGLIYVTDPVSKAELQFWCETG